MKRIEIIFSQSIDEEFVAACAEKNVAKGFSKMQNVQGQGNSNPKRGDGVWPQLNSLYVIYCESDDVPIIQDIIVALRERFPTEGIACFVSKDDFSEY